MRNPEEVLEPLISGTEWVAGHAMGIPAHEPAVRDAVAALGLDYAHARFGSIDLIYKSELGRDILAEPTLLLE